jgi:hypothetical protein
MSIFTQDLSANPQLRPTNLAEVEDQRFSIHEKVGRKGLGTNLSLLQGSNSRRRNWMENKNQLRD